MKIWIDFINSPQVSFFVPFIKEFISNNNEVFLTCRDSGNTIGLLDQHRLQYYLVGRKVGKHPIQKIYLFTQRLYILFNLIRKIKPQLAASQSSFYQPIIARLLRIPCLYTNDNEHAKGNIFGFLFANKIVLPKVLQDLNFTKKWPLKNKVYFYPSIKEAIYLLKDPELFQIVKHNKEIIYFRPEPWSAQYYKGPLNFFDETLLSLSKLYNVIVLPRDKKQTVYYQQEKFAGIKVALNPLRLREIVSDCLLFIGAGGSMSRELAILGIPVISIYKEELLSVDKYLVQKGLMKVIPDITFQEINLIINSEIKDNHELFALYEGEKSYSLFKELLNDLKDERTKRNNCRSR